MESITYSFMREPEQPQTLPAPPCPLSDLTRKRAKQIRFMMEHDKLNEIMKGIEERMAGESKIPVNLREKNLGKRSAKC